MAEQIQRKFEQDKRKKAVIAKAAVLQNRKIKANALIDKDMVEIAERNGRSDMLSMVEGATFFA